LKTPHDQGYAYSESHGDKDILRGVAPQVHPGEADQKKGEDEDCSEGGSFCIKGKREIKRCRSLGVAAGEGISGCGRNSTFDRGKGRIKNPRPWNAEGDLQSLDTKTGGKVGKAEKIGKTLICAPVQCADNGDNDDLLSKIGDKLHELVEKRGSDVIKKP